jgi:hypothetical protein
MTVAQPASLPGASAARWEAVTTDGCAVLGDREAARALSCRACAWLAARADVDDDVAERKVPIVHFPEPGRGRDSHRRALYQGCAGARPLHSCR